MYKLVKLISEYGFLISLSMVIIYILIGHIHLKNAEKHTHCEYEEVHNLIEIIYDNYGIPFPSGHTAKISIICDDKNQCNIIITTL